MYEQFKARAVGVSAEVFRFVTKSAALSWLLAFLQKEGLADTPQTSALWAESSFLDGLDVDALKMIAGLKFEVTRELAAEARFGISQMDWALADTGSLVQNSTAMEQRLVSSLSTIHIALVPTAAILPDMPSLLSRMNPKENPYIAMITGPSRTADIERVLTIGVHGPERLVIVFVDELGGGF
ncbi:MAG: lactate utilization protein [Desulfuromonadaceae bacterium]|nr:lactate utilization protein [Desulfuromonadaceae bacterium]MDD2846887.1 lactate utilization protein [Desulfuromonadaceae bacterium]MDD4129135.1 lactate utilization protein [Desulfuromonadaceae bacterium]